MIKLNVSQSDGKFFATQAGSDPIRHISGEGATASEACAVLLNYYAELVRSGDVDVGELTGVTRRIGAPSPGSDVCLVECAQ